MVISFFVPGIPAPGGSKKGFVNPKTGHVVIVDDAKYNKDWRKTVSAEAFAHLQSINITTPMRCPLRVNVCFCLPRPKGHYRTGKNVGLLRRGSPVYHTIRPDATKLWRSTEDALTGIAWYDDAQIVSQRVRKTYTNPQLDMRLAMQEPLRVGTVPGALIEITVIGDYK